MVKIQPFFRGENLFKDSHFESLSTFSNLDIGVIFCRFTP